MKLKRTFKTLLMIIATVMSVVSGILIDSGTLAYAATTYTLTLNWDDGVEWVATDKDGIYRWEKGGSKTFQAGSKAYTYVKLKNGATVKSFFSRQENKDWTDYTYTSGSLCYDTWTMYNNRNVDIYTSVSSSADVSYDWDNLVTSSKHYHSSNGNESSWSNLRDDLGRSPAPVYSIYYKLQENRYRETCYGDNQEDKDFGGYEIMLRTEDSHNSYWYGQSSYANGDRFDDWYRDEFEGIKLSNLAIVPVQIKGDKFLQINISVKNTNSYAKEISLATCSDIQVADDDNATTFFNGNGFTMTNMYCETSTAQLGTIPTATLNVYAKDVPGYVTDADAVYIGHFVYRKQHIWSNNVLGDKTTYFNKKPHGGTSGEGESDSGFSIAWKNRTIAAGQTQTYSYIIGIGKYNSNNKITFNTNGGELKTPGTSINNPSGNYSNKVTVTYGTDTYSSMSNDIPERAGYTFEGWWTTPNDSNASVMVYDASGKCNNDCNYWKNNQWQGTNDLTVYAHWKANTYTVRLNTGDIPSSELTKLTETASTEGWTWNENGRYFSKAFVQNENNYLPGVNKFFSANNYESVGSKVTDKYFVQDKTKNPTKVLYNWWTSASGGTDIGRGKKIYNNLYEISKDNSGIVNLYPHWMGYTTVFNYTATAPSNTAGQIVTINNNINDGMDNNLYQVYGNCFFYKGTDGEYHDYEGTNPDLKVTASIPDSNGYKYIFNGWHHKNWNYLTDGLGKLTYKNNYNIGQGKTSYSLSPHFSRVGINYNVRLNANVPENTESTLQVLHQNGISSYIYNSTSRYFSRELTYDDSQDMLSPDVYSLKGYHLINRSNWYTEKTGGNTVSAPCNNTEAEYPDWAESNWNLTTEDGATVDLYARWQANNYKIAYNLDGGTYGTSHPTSADYDTMVTIDNPSKSGYTFTGWTITGYDPNTSGHSAVAWTGETGASFKNLASTEGKTVTFTATWVQKNVHLVTISGRGIKLSKPLSYDGHVGETKRITAELKPGYRFVNWTNYYNANEVISTDKDFDYKITDKDYDNSLSNKGGTYLKSNAVPIDYTITYKLNGGTASNPASYNVESNTFTLNNPTRAGYTFAGWCESKDTSYVYNRNANEVIKKDESDSTSCFIPECHASLDYAPVFDPAYYLAKYPDLKSAYGDDANKALSHFVKYGMKEGRQGSAEFEVNAYKAKYKDLKDAFGDNLQKYYIHYILAGKSEGRTISQASVSIYQGSTGNRTYTATWTPINYTISYDLNGGAVAISNPTSYNVETPTFTLNNPVKLGYVFVGWTGSNGITPQKSVSIYKGSTGNKSYKANWTAADIGYTVNHYVMDINGNYPSTPTKAERLSGFTDTSVTAKRLNFGNGFTYPDVQTVKVKADGTTVVNYYYARNKYTLDLNGFISSVSRPNLTEEVDGQIFIAGKATVTVNGKVLATNETDFCQMVYYGSSYKITTVPEAGYSIIGNTTVEGTMPASDKTVTITINANKDTKYIVRHWKEKLYLDGTKTYADSSKHNTTNYFLADTDNLTGQTNRLVTPTVKTYEGFTSPSTITVRVKGDGSLIVDYYYTRNTYTLKTDDSDSNKDDQDNGIKSGNGIDSSKTNVISEGNNKKDNKKKFKYEEVVTVTTDTLSGYHWHVNDDCETIKRNLYPTGWSDHEGYRVEKWYTENGKTYGYKDQTTKFYMPAHDVKLDVNATNNSYKIIFEKNKPMNVTNPYTGAVSSASNEITGTVTDTFYIYNHANQKLPGNVYNLTGWTFKGWSLKKDYSNGYGFGWEYGTNSWNNDLSHLTTKNLDVIHMYAKWEANRYQITFNYEHNSSNPYGNLGYDEKAEAATKLTKNGADSKTATYDAKVGSLPNPTLTGATFVKWVDSKGNEYTEDTIYKITSPITLYAVWQQNTGTFAYIANGITYNNNGIGVYEATNSDGTNQFKAMTEDITLEENKFGTTMENTSYNNFTKKSKYGYVIINAGTSYAKETDTSGDSVYYSFQGWSANNYATVAGDKNAGLIHQIGYKDRLFNYAYETMANEMNTLGTGYNSKDTSVADSIRAKANELYNTKELTQNNTYAIMYAVWDQFPVIKSDQVVLTINDFSAYINENANGFEQHAYDVIKDRIINANTVKDREDGNIRDNIEIENLDEILNMMLTMYKTPGMTSSMVTIRTHVSDSVGNTTYGYTTVALINNKAKQDDPIIPTVDEDGKEINTRILSAKVRSITREFYNTGYERSSDYKSDYSAATYKNYGGLIPNSIWYKNEEYVKTINQCFDNFDNNTPEQTWYFTHDDVLSIQEYAKQHKDTPHGVEDGELTNFYNKYKSCIIQGIDAS